jgi:hypothetical protein
MAGSLTNYGESKVLAHLFGGTTYAPVATWYIALFSVAPTDTTAGTELTGGGYSRAAVTNNTTNFPAANPTVNGADITLFTSSGTHSAVAMGFVDAASGGNLVAYSTLTTPQSIVNLDVVRIVAGQLSVSLD